MIGEDITILRGTPALDPYSGQVTATSWANPTRIPVRGVAVAPRTSSENNDHRQAVITGLTVYLPAGTDLRATDRMVVRGHVHEVEGQPGVWRNPFTGRERGVEAALRKVEG